MSWRTFKTMNFTSRLWGNGATINRKALKNVLNLCGEFLKVFNVSRRSVMLAEKIYMASVLKLCPNLTTVDLTSIKVGVPLMTAIIQYCKNTVILCLGEITWAAFGWFKNCNILSTFTNLQVLNIESMNDDEYSGEIFSGNWIKFWNNNLIQELRLEYCYGLEKSNIYHVSYYKMKLEDVI